MPRRVAAALFLAGVAGAFLCAPLVAQEATQQQPRYGSWGPAGDQQAQELLQSLKALIDEAEKARAADPLFLQDLKDLVRMYENPWPLRLFSDDFRDGEYARNPTWTVSAGQFAVQASGNALGLRSSVTMTPGAAATPPPTTPLGLGVAILGTILQGQTGTAGTSGGAAQPAASKYASIYSPVKVSNAFALRLELASQDRSGRFDVGLYQGPSGGSAYRLVYFPGAATGMQLLRVTPQGSVAIGSLQQPLPLEDGKTHLLEWTRDRIGAMRVAVDGKALIAASDTALAQPFDGIYLVNGGGSYWVRSIGIDGSK